MAFGKTVTNELMEPFARRFVGRLVRALEESRTYPLPILPLFDIIEVRELRSVVGEADGKVLKNPSFSVGQVLYCEHNTRFYRYTYPSQIYATYLEVLAE